MTNQALTKYEARKSIMGSDGGKIILCAILFFLIVPIFFMVYYIVRARSYRLTFSGNNVTVTGGVFEKYDRKSVLTAVTNVSVYQSFWGRIFNYGDVRIDIVGRWDVDTHAIKNPQGLKNYVESLMQAQDVSKLQQFIVN